MGSTAPPMGQPLPFKDGEFTSLSQPSVVTWKTKDVELPSPLYITRDDVLVVQATSQTSSEVVTINARLLTIDGVIIPIQRQLSILTPFTTGTMTIPVCEGFLLSVTAVGLLSLQRGLTYVRMWLNRGAAASANAVQMLMSDYVTQLGQAGWPAGTLKYPSEGPGQSWGLQVTAPGAGAEWTTTQPTNTRWHVRGVFAQLVCSATVANRAVQFRVLDPFGRVLVLSSANVVLTASQTGNIVAATFSNSSIIVPLTLYLPWPSDLLTPGGSTFSSLTAGLQAGDQWGQITFLLESWLDNI